MTDDPRRLRLVPDGAEHGGETSQLVDGVSAEPAEDNGHALSLTEAVAAELRAVAGRRRVSGAALARVLGRRHGWVCGVLAGRTSPTLTELAQFCGALDVDAVELLYDVVELLDELFV